MRSPAKFSPFRWESAPPPRMALCRRVAEEKGAQLLIYRKRQLRIKREHPHGDNERAINPGGADGVFSASAAAGTNRVLFA